MENLTKEQDNIVKNFSEQHEVSNEISLRFLLGRKWDKDRADTLLDNYIKLKTEKAFEKLTVSEVMDELQTGKLKILGTKAKDGSAILMIDAVKHTPGQFSDSSTLKLSFYMAEVITQEVETQRDGITVLCNMDGLNWEQSDYAFYRDVIQLFQNNFPCRVKNIIVFRPPWWIKMLIGFVSPFMKPKMRNRIHMESEIEKILDWIEEANLPSEFGGTFTYDHDAFVKRQLAKASTAKIAGIMGKKEENHLEEVPLDDKVTVDETLAGELVEEREKAVKELDAAIQKRRQSLTSQQRPIDFTKLARSKAARMNMSLADTMPFSISMVTPQAPPPSKESREEIVDVETIETSKQEETSIVEPPPPQPTGFLQLSDDEVDVEKVDDTQLAPEGDQKRISKRRSKDGKKKRPTAIQM